MRIVRSWPTSAPADRPRILDGWPRLIQTNYDYTPLGDLADDVLLVEWDMAVGLGDLERFAAHASQRPSRVLVAPYPLYHIGPVVQAHRRVTGPTPADVRPIRANEPTCDLFGFGLVYLPGQMIAEFVRQPPAVRGVPPGSADDADPRFTDHTFSVWHYWHARLGPVAVDWSVRPVHLHYQLPSSLGLSGKR